MRYRHEDIYRNSRFAGLVKRYHTWPVTRDQSTGEHTWQVMRIYWQCFGPLSPAASTFVLWHDSGELVAGDSPGMLKQEAPELKPVLDRIEAYAVSKMDGPGFDWDAIPDISLIRLRCKICDLLDVYEFGKIEVLQGNRLAEPIVRWASDQIAARAGRLAREDFDAVLAYQLKFEDWCNK